VDEGVTVDGKQPGEDPMGRHYQESLRLSQRVEEAERAMEEAEKAREEDFVTAT
jgi:hypothetical protein